MPCDQIITVRVDLSNIKTPEHIPGAMSDLGYMRTQPNSNVYRNIDNGITATIYGSRLEIRGSAYSRAELAKMQADLTASLPRQVAARILKQDCKAKGWRCVAKPGKQFEYNVIK